MVRRGASVRPTAPASRANGSTKGAVHATPLRSSLEARTGIIEFGSKRICGLASASVPTESNLSHSFVDLCTTMHHRAGIKILPLDLETNICKSVPVCVCEIVFGLKVFSRLCVVCFPTERGSAEHRWTDVARLHLPAISRFSILPQVKPTAVGRPRHEIQKDGLASGANARVK